LAAECATGICSSCRQGYIPDTNACKAVLCWQYGCGWSSIGIVCTEVSTTTFSCKCPLDSSATDVTTTQGTFSGCSLALRPTPEQIIQQLYADYIGGFLTRVIPDLISVSLDSTDASAQTFVIGVEFSGTLDALEVELKSALADFLEFTPGEILLSNVTSGSTSTSIEVHIQEALSSASLVGPMLAVVVALALNLLF